MSTDLLINLSYTVAAVLFILGLKFLGSPATARRGNTLSALGMLLAVGCYVVYCCFLPSGGLTCSILWTEV